MANIFWKVWPRPFQLTKKIPTYLPTCLHTFLSTSLREHPWGAIQRLFHLIRVIRAIRVHTKLYSSKQQKPKIPICIYSNCIFRSIHAAYASSKLSEFLVLVYNGYNWYNGHNGHNGYNGYNWYNCILLCGHLSTRARHSSSPPITFHLIANIRKPSSTSQKSNKLFKIPTIIIPTIS